MRETSIKQMIQRMVSAQVKTTKVVTGTVTSTDPLEITLVNDLNNVLSATSMAIPSRLGDLELGETFYMLSTNNDKTYYVVDRV